MRSSPKFRVIYKAPNGLKHGFVTSIYTTKLLAKLKLEEDLKIVVNEKDIEIEKMPEEMVLDWARMYTKTSEFDKLSFQEKIAHCKKYDL